MPMTEGAPLSERICVALAPGDARELLLLIAARPRAAAELRATLRWRRIRVKTGLAWLASQGWIERTEQHARSEEDQVYELAVDVPRRLGMTTAPWKPPPSAPLDPLDRACLALEARRRAEEDLQRAHLALMAALAELPSCEDCPVGGRDGEGLPCPRAPVCDAECAERQAVYDAERGLDELRLVPSPASEPSELGVWEEARRLLRQP